MNSVRTTAVACLLLLGLASFASPARNDGALWRPRFATPAIAALDTSSKRQFTAEVRGTQAATGWSVIISNDLRAWSCTVISAKYATVNRGTEPGWRIIAGIPPDASPELFTVVVASDQTVSAQPQAL